MPRFRTLSPEETAKLQTRRGRSVDLTDYLAALRDLALGQVGEAALGDEEKKSTVKRRLTSAAKQMGRSLRYRRSGDRIVIFEVTGGRKP
jgi:hypothetical protein